MTNTQLPAEIERRINEQFERHTCSNGMRIDIKKFVSDVVAEYATKLNQANEDKDLIRMAYECSQKERDELQAKCERYEQTLIAIGNGCATPQYRANEAIT